MLFAFFQRRREERARPVIADAIHHQREYEEAHGARQKERLHALRPDRSATYDPDQRETSVLLRVRRSYEIHGRKPPENIAALVRAAVKDADADHR